MTENFNSMYWIRKRVEYEELSQALRAAERRKRRAEAARARRQKKAAAKQPANSANPGRE